MKRQLWILGITTIALCFGCAVEQPSRISKDTRGNNSLVEVSDSKPSNRRTAWRFIWDNAKEFNELFDELFGIASEETNHSVLRIAILALSAVADHNPERDQRCRQIQSLYELSFVHNMPGSTDLWDDAVEQSKRRLIEDGS